MTVTALRDGVFEALDAGLTIPHGMIVHKFRRRHGTETRTRPVLEFSVSAAGDEPDRAALDLRLSVGAVKLDAGEATVDDLLDAIDGALPAQVDPPAWSVAYDVDGSSWVATGAATAFRE